MRIYVLLDGSFEKVGQAAAAAVLELALAGYLTIEPGDDRYSTAIVTRTERSADGLSLEQRMLLRALLGAEDGPRISVCLRAPRQLPVAQTIMAVARAQMTSESLIHAMRPQTVYRWAAGAFAALATCSVMAVTLVTGTVSGFFLTLLCVLGAWRYFRRLP